MNGAGRMGDAIVSLSCTLAGPVVRDAECGLGAVEAASVRSPPAGGGIHHEDARAPARRPSSNRPTGAVLQPGPMEGDQAMDYDDEFWEAHEARRRALPDPHTYSSAGDWYHDYRGFVPIQMARGLSLAMKERGLTFPEAWDLLVGRGAIVMIEYPDDPPKEQPAQAREAVGRTTRAAKGGRR